MNLATLAQGSVVTVAAVSQLAIVLQHIQNQLNSEKKNKSLVDVYVYVYLYNIYIYTCNRICIIVCISHCYIHSFMYVSFVDLFI